MRVVVDLSCEPAPLGTVGEGRVPAWACEKGSREDAKQKSCAAMPGKWLSSCTVPTAKKHLHSFLMTGTNPRRPQPLFGMASSSSVLRMISSAAYGKVRLRERRHWLGLPQTQIFCFAGNARSLLQPYAGSRVVEVQATQVRRNRTLVSVPSSEPGEGDRRQSGQMGSTHTSWVCLGLGL